MMPRSHPAALVRTAAVALAPIVVILGWAVDRRAFFACWLAGWWTCAGVVLGAQANLWLHDLTGGEWGGRLRPVWRRAAVTMPGLLVLMLPLLAAVWTFYPWSDPAWAPESRRPGFQMFWLSPSFVVIRLVIYAAIWQGLSLVSMREARRAEIRSRHKGRSALALIVYGITVSLAGVDLVMALMPQWHSSGFGFIVITMQMKLGFAWGVLCATSPGRWTARGREAPGQSPSTARDASFPAQLGRDWGNMLLMYVMMWAYLAYVQFLIIWAENLPEEISWYVPRLQSGWAALGLLLVVFGFFVPLLLLLLRAVKQRRGRLRGLAALIALSGWAESVWIVLPSVKGLSGHAWWMSPLVLGSMVLFLWTIMQPRPLRRLPVRPPPPAIAQKEIQS